MAFVICAFIDSYSRFNWIYSLRAKFDFYDMLVHFHKFVFNQFSNTIKVFQRYGGTEFVNARVRDYAFPWHSSSNVMPIYFSTELAS